MYGVIDYRHDKLFYLLVSFANSLDPDQPDRTFDKMFDTLMVFLKQFFEKKKLILKKKQLTIKKNMKNYPGGKELK